MGRFAFLIPALIVVSAVQGTQAAASPKFRNISVPSGLLSDRQIQKRRPYTNKYWGSTIADFNRDGLYDIFVSNHGNNPEYYIAKESGGFQYQDPNKYEMDIHSSAAADMDNDGYLDIVVSHGGGRGNMVDGTPVVHLGNTSPVEFTEEVGSRLGLGGVPMRGRSVSFIDMNADGHLDLLFCNRRNQSATKSHLLYKNQGNGKFVVRREFGIQGVEADWFALIDANDDSYLDILLMRSGNVELWVGNGSFNFREAKHLIPDYDKLHAARSAAELDIDRDGDMDLILVRGAFNGIRDIILLEKTERGYVTIDKAVSKLPPGNYYHVTVGDLNNDGFPDLFISRVTHFESPRLNDLVFINNGDKSFTRATGTGTERAGSDTDGDNGVIADFDMDGRPDLLVGSRNSAWRMYQNITPAGSRHYVHVRVGSPRAELVAPEQFRRKSLGALVKVFCGGNAFLGRVGSPGQSHSQSYMDTLHFGLGECRRLERIEVHYTGNVVVTRTNRLGVDRLIEVGLYFPCPKGFTGRRCNLSVSRCRAARCAEGAACEVAEVVGDDCGTCIPSGNAELLRNGNFEGDLGWKVKGFARYITSYSFAGTRSMRLRLGFSQVSQDVILDRNKMYDLTCRVFDGSPVGFKIQRDDELVSSDWAEASENIEGQSRWKLKIMKFKTGRAGRHSVIFETGIESAGAIDDCSLTQVGSGSGCTRTSCTKLNCQL